MSSSHEGQILGNDQLRRRGYVFVVINVRYVVRVIQLGLYRNGKFLLLECSCSHSKQIEVHRVIEWVKISGRSPPNGRYLPFVKGG